LEVYIMISALDSALRRSEEIRALASDLHAHPELGMHETRTTEKLRLALSKAGAEIVGLGCETGVAALIRGGSGKRIALRADIDAIRQTEEVERPDASTVPGVMHGCGHDAHTAGLYGAALILLENREALRGDVLLVFQPAEETLKGAEYMLSHGVLRHFQPDAIFGLHNLPELPVGTVGVKSGPLMSFKDGFSIRYDGRSGHTSTPQKNVDPTVAIASLVMSLQTVVSRNVGPLESAVLTVCSISAGAPFTTTIDSAAITGNIRTLDPEVRSRVLDRVRAIAAATAEAFGCRADIDIGQITPGVINSEELLPTAKKAAAEVVGSDHVVIPSVNLASEDFAILSRGIPSFFYFLGSGTPGTEPVSWHNPRFRAAPDTPVYGAALLAQSVFEAQRAGGPLT
jgi:amidohydrolase